MPHPDRVIAVDLNNVARIHGGRTVFRGLSLSIQDGERIGLIGPSGTGKSSLLRIIAGLEPPDGGNVTFRRGLKVAFLEQEFSGKAGRTVLAEVLAGHEELAALEERIAAAEERMADPAVLEDAAAFEQVLLEHERLLSQFDTLGGASLTNRAQALLLTLGLDESNWSQPVELLSGGQRKLVGLARALLSEPGLLLLDEPDNHLDIDRKAVLERVVRDFRGAVVVVSHDRYLLDDTVGVILELEPAREAGAAIRRWEGNYSAYAAQKELALLRQQQDYTAQQKEIARLEAAVARFKLWASMVLDERHIKQARNKQRQIDRMEKVERPVLERRKMSLHFTSGQRGGAKTFELRDVDKAYGDRIILLGARATVMNGERVGIVGPNGSGKSVLLRLILGMEAADSGTVWVGPSIRTGYYAQEHETLDLTQTPVEALRGVKAMYESDAVSQLGRFLIPYEAASQPMAKLSGGEKSRVQLARLMLMGANCLVLDEPTNNLDIASAEVLEAAIDAFAGTVVVVSHDRYFLDRLVDRIFEVRDGTLRVYDGGYSYYAEASS